MITAALSRTAHHGAPASKAPAPVAREEGMAATFMLTAVPFRQGAAQAPPVLTSRPWPGGEGWGASAG